MHKLSKLCYGITFLSLLIIAAVYFMLQVWIPLLYFFLFAAIAGVVVAIMLDWKLLLEFFTLRTTKHGMNMGVLILLTLAALVCVNYLSVHYNKTFDLTAEKLYSLSDQTKHLISGLNGDVQVTVFYKGPPGLQEKSQIQKVLDLYKDYSAKVKVRYFDTYVDEAEAQNYLASLPDKDQAKMFAFVEINGKRIRVVSPFDENQITGAIVKATRRGDKKIYFLVGHGERELDSDNPDGLKSFKSALEQEAFKVDTLNLLEKNEIPKDADFIAIVGPKTPYLEPELAKLRDYAQNGGRLLIAIDPGQRHNLAGFIKQYGIEFENNYVVSLSRGGFTTLAVAVIFSPTSKITQDFKSGTQSVYAAFDLASELRSAPDVPNGLKVTDIVKSSPVSLALSDLHQRVTSRDLSGAKSFTLAEEVKGRLDHDANGKVTETNSTAEKDKQFEAVVFGDSDFVSNQSILLGINRDLALNAAADLAHETDLIGTHPKSYKGTVIDIGAYQELGIFGAGIGLPIFLLIASGVMWFRRRGA